MYPNVKKLREEFHLSTGYVTRYLGITERTYLENERGDFPFTAQEMEKLCNLYGIPVEDRDNFIQDQEDMIDKDWLAIFNLSKVREWLTKN